MRLDGSNIKMSHIKVEDDNFSAKKQYPIEFPCSVTVLLAVHGVC